MNFIKYYLVTSIVFCFLLSNAHAGAYCGQIYHDTRISDSQTTKKTPKPSLKLSEEFAEITQTQKDVDMPDRYDTDRDWGTRLLSDTDPTWSDPEFLAGVQKFLAPSITNYGGKAQALLEEHETLLNKFVPGKVLNFTTTGTDANNMLFEYAREHFQRKSGIKPTQMQFLTFEDIYGGSYGKILELQQNTDAHIKGPFHGTNEVLDSEKLIELENLEKNALDLIETKIRDKNNQIGGIFMESIPAAHGVKVFRTKFLLKLRELADRYDTPIFADEILTGGGRTGKFWAFQHHDGFIPDLVTFGKGLGTSGIFAPRRPLKDGVKLNMYGEIKNEIDRPVEYRNASYDTTTQINPLALMQSTQILKTIWNRRLDLNAGITGRYLMARTRYEINTFNKTAPDKNKIDMKKLSGVGLLITGFPRARSDFQYQVEYSEQRIFGGDYAYNQRVMPILTSNKVDIEWVLNNKLNWKTKNPMIYSSEFQRTLSAFASMSKNKIVDIDLSNDVSVTGQLSGVELDEKQALAFIKFNGKFQFENQGTIVSLQDTNRHPEGYSIPIGKMKELFIYDNINKDHDFLDKYWSTKNKNGRTFADEIVSTKYSKLKTDWNSKNNLQKSEIQEGTMLKFNYANGIELKGIVKKLKYDNEGNLIIMTFKQATVEYQGKILFRPEWGDYDIPIAEFASKITPQ